MPKKSQRKKETEEGQIKFSATEDTFDGNVVNSSDEEEEEPQYPARKERNKKVEKNIEKKKDEESSSSDEEEESSSSEEEEEESSSEEDMPPNHTTKKKINAKTLFSSTTQTSEKEWKNTQITFVVTGSANDFSKNPEKAVLSIKGDSSKIFGSKGSSSLIEGKSKNAQNSHILKEVRLTSFVNTFPFAIAMCVDGVDIEANSFTSTGGHQNARHIFLPNTESSTINKVIIEGNALSKDNFFLKKFPGVDLNNLAQGITYPDQNPDSPQAFVKTSSPIWAAFVNSFKLSSKKLAAFDKQGYALVDTVQAKQALKSVEDLLKNEIQVRDLSKISYQLKRAFTRENANKEIGAEWTDNTEVKDIHGKNVSNAFEQKGTLYATFEYVYRDV